MNGRPVTPEEDAVLIEHAGEWTILRLAEQLGRSQSVIQDRIQRLITKGLLAPKHPSHHRAWTTDDDQELRGRAGYDRIDRIALELGRTAVAVKTRAMRLGISLEVRGAYSLATVARIFGVDGSTVRLWVQRKALVATARRNRYRRRYRVDHLDLEAFVHAHPELYRADLITDPFWRELADRAAQPLLTLAEASTVLHYSRQVLNDRCLRGELPAVRGRRRAWLVKVS